MDAAELLREARTRAQLSQRDLAGRARVSRTSVGAYERGTVSPTVDQLDALLAACGLMIRAQLVPLSADLDEQVEELLTGVPRVDTARLVHVAGTFDASGVTWAVDGPTALALQGLAVAGPLSYAVVLDDPLRLWIARHALKVLDRQGDSHVLQGDAPEDWMAAALARGPAFGMMGVLTVGLRLVPAVDDPLTIEVEGREVPVLRWSDVLPAHPDRAKAVRAAVARQS